MLKCLGFGNVAPKTKGGRAFCILYGLCGIPLCLVWISELGSFFGDRAKRLSQVLIRKGISVVRNSLVAATHNTSSREDTAVQTGLLCDPFPHR